MLRGLENKKFFPARVFLILLVATELLIFLAAAFTRPRDIAVSRAVVATIQDERIDSRAVDRFMVENMRRMGVPGAIVAITHNGRILHAAGYGKTTQGQVTADTRLPIASLTKSFTAAAVMQLVESGALNLETPVVAYVPDLKFADPRGAKITVRHLLSQTSGLTNRTLPPAAANVPASLAERVQQLRGATLTTEPGTRFAYCNDNYNLLALVVERVSGLPFSRFLNDRLFRPLGMTASGYAASPRALSSGEATGYSLIFGLPVPTRMPDEFTGGGAGVLSSANDLARWLVLQSGGGKTSMGESLLSSDSLATMHTPTVPGSNYAFGWQLSALPDGTNYLHHSGKEPPFAAHQRLYPDTGYAFAIVINGFHGFNAEAASFIAGLNDIVMGRPAVIAFPYTLGGVPLGAVADNLIAVLMVFALTVAAVGVVRSRIWAQRIAGRSLWLVVIRCTPYLAVLALALLLPWWMSVVNRGQVVAWKVIYSAWPALVICAVVWAAAATAVVVARGVQLRIFSHVSACPR